MSDDLTKEQKEELEKLQKEIIDEAKKVVENYVDNPTDISEPIVESSATYVNSTDLAFNLVPYAPKGWSSPLVIVDNMKFVQSPQVFGGGETFISWTVSNDSSMDINQEFFVDLYFCM